MPVDLACSNCSVTIREDWAEVAGWRYWSDGIELHPFCEVCSASSFRPTRPRRPMLDPAPDGRNTDAVLVLRFAFAIGVVAAAVWLLRAGLPFGAVVVVLMAVWLRRTIEARSSLASH